ncbi:MAG: arsenate reductase (glutaredoxin) [Rhodobacteraceae bacterium]|nr:arsenate reductase (glutaredoxin) [Paracoccaceae bacterium]
MSKTEIWHNPRCSKSRETLKLLQEAGINPDVVLYKETAPSIETIHTVLAELGIPAQALIRQNDPAFKALGLAKDASAEALVAAMANHPAIIERPIVRHRKKAALGRPPEAVLALFE